MLNEMFSGIGIGVCIIFIVVVVVALASWLYNEVIGKPARERRERAAAIEKLAKEQALLLAKIEPSDLDQTYWGNIGTCKAGFQHLRWDAVQLFKDEYFVGKIERVRKDVNENGVLTPRGRDVEL